MPPPPRPCSRSRLLGRATSNEKTSPYFPRDEGDLCTTTKPRKEDRSSQSRDQWDNGHSIWPLRETTPSRSHDESATSAQGPSSKLPSLPVQVDFEQSVTNLEAVITDPVRSVPVTMPTDEYRECSPSEDEEEKRIHAEASIEKRGFRSAKSLERSIVKKRKLRH